MNLNNKKILSFLFVSIIYLIIFLFFSAYTSYAKINTFLSDTEKPVYHQTSGSMQQNHPGDQTHKINLLSSDHGRKQRLHAESEDQSDPWSNAFNFSKVWGTQIDPRTGMLDFHVKTGSLLSNFGHGPNIDLEIHYNMYTTTNMDRLGHGWNWNLTHFNPETNQLTTSFGQSFYLQKKANNQWIPQYHKLTDILIKGDKSTHFTITYTNGLRETLDHEGYETRLEQQDGHGVQFIYMSGNHQLQRIVDDQGNKIIIQRHENYITVTSSDSRGKPVNVNLDYADDKLQAVILPLKNRLKGPGIYISYANSLISKIVYPTGLQEILTYNCNDAMKLPAQNRLSAKSICVVSGKTTNPGAGQPAMKTDYAYSQTNANGHNYLAFNSGIPYVKQLSRDILFDAPSDYTYYTLQDNGIYKEIRKYNKYHLLVNDRKISDKNQHLLSEVKSFYCRNDKDDGCAFTSFKNLPATYSLPLKIVTRLWGESGRTPAVTINTIDYDKQGRVTRYSDSYGRTTKTVYCPANGDHACPPVAKGWLPNALPEIITNYPAKKLSALSQLHPITTYYYYQKLPNLNIKGYIPITSMQIFKVNNQQHTIKRYYYQNPADTFTYGLLHQLVLTGTATESVTKNYYYTKSGDNHKKTTYSTIELSPGKFNPSPLITTSLFTNQVLEKSSFDQKNKTVYYYDNWSRLIQTDMAVGTHFSTHTSYQYIVSSQLNQLLITSANGLQEKIIFDGTGRNISGFKEALTASGRADMNHWLPKYKISYNHYGQLVKKNIYWFDLSDKMHTQTTTIDYDYAGRVRHTYMSNGQVAIATYDDPDHCQVSYKKSSQGQYSVISVLRTNDLDQPVEKVILPEQKQLLTSERKLCLTANQRPDAKIFTTIYDGFGRVIAATDPSGRTVHKVYDEWGRVTDIISPSGDRVHLLYNLTGQVTEKQVFPATGGKYVLSSSAYNAGGQQLWSAGEDGKRTTYTYRQDGKISSVLLPSGHKLVWKYNILGLPTVKILDGKVIVKTDYDFVTALPVRKEDNTGITTWQYSDDGLLQQLIHIGKNKHPDYKLQWKFDQNRRLISTSDISGNKTTTHYDVLGYLKALYYLPANSHNIADLLYKPVYDGFFRISGAYYGSGMQRHIKYDNYGHLQTVSDTLNQQLLSQWSYTYDVNDNITTIHQTVGKSDKGRLNYRYDVRNNLVSMTCSGSVGLPLCPRDTAFSGSNLHDAPVITRQNYTFTPLNRIAQAEEILQDDKQRKTLIKSTHYSYDTKIPLRLQSINVEWNHTIFNHTHFVYDQSGNMLRDGEDNQITYNAFNQVIQVITPSGEHSYYRYDGNGKKIMEQNRLGLRYFFYSGESLINERITGIEKTTHLIGYQRIARTVDGVIQQYYESNYKGDISGILTKDRNSNNQYHLSYRNIYSPYGMSWHQASASSLPFYLQSVHGFDGERTDPATGWQFLGNGHRTYNPRMRYFVSEDPVGDGYAFGSNNPIMNTDPDGNTPKWLRTVGQIMGYAGTLGFSAIPKKWARITGTVLAAGLCAVGAGLLASSYGTSAVIETVTVNAVVGGFSVASTIATNKGLNIAAEIAGGIMVAGIVTSGLLKLGFSAFSAINTNFFAGAAEEFANPVENSDELIIRRIYPNPHITDNYTQMVEQFIIRNSADLDVELTDVRGTSTFSFLDALKKFSHFFGPISSIEHQITYLALDLENEKDLQMLVNDYIQIDRYSVVYFNYQDIEIERFLIVTLEEYHEENLYVPLEEYAARFTTDFASRTVFVNNRDKLLENNFKNNLQRFYKNYFIFISRIKYYGPVFDGTKYPEKVFHPMFVEAVEQMSSQ